jgi:hypothetical protein
MLNRLAPLIRTGARIGFWLALVAVLYLAWTPAPPIVGPDDKTQHMMAFGTLTLLLRLGYPALGWVAVLGWMGALGWLIEIVQLVPALHRQFDGMDWLADMAAVVVALIAGQLVLACCRPLATDRAR